MASTKLRIRINSKKINDSKTPLPLVSDFAPADRADPAQHTCAPIVAVWGSCLGTPVDSWQHAAVNEVFLEAVEYLPKKDRKSLTKKKRGQKRYPQAINDPQAASYRVAALSTDVIKTMARIWLQQEEYTSWIRQNLKFKSHFVITNHDNNIPNWHPALDKYQLALGLNKKRAIGKLNSKRSNVETLREFRNSLVHYEPGWSVSAGNGTFKPIGKMAKVKRRVELLINSDIRRPVDGYPNETKFCASGFS